MVGLQKPNSHFIHVTCFTATLVQGSNPSAGRGQSGLCGVSLGTSAAPTAQRYIC